jgi:hypothetical protein
LGSAPVDSVLIHVAVPLWTTATPLIDTPARSVIHRQPDRLGSDRPQSSRRDCSGPRVLRVLNAVVSLLRQTPDLKDRQVGTAGLNNGLVGPSAWWLCERAL